MKCRRMEGTAENLSEVSELLGLRSKMELQDVQVVVEEILRAVEERGDEAVLFYTQKLDKADLTATGLRVTEDELEAAVRQVEPSLIRIMEKAAGNILAFHERQKESGFQMDVEQGGYVGMRVRPLSVAGIYIPGGTAPLPSTVLMDVIPAAAAGVKRIVFCTPPGPDGQIAPVILAAARIAGAHEIYKIGGAQAIAAMAYGTETVPKVDKICGPGNIYVNVAKRLVFGRVDIDMFAGPSEILVLADETANPAYVAADLLSQAEHDVLASAILVTTSVDLADAVEKELETQRRQLDRQAILEKSIPDYCCIITVPDLETAVAFSNALAPEHLELCVRDSEACLERIENAGAVFLGHYTPEPLGDYFAGPNHTLPTSGTSRFFSPLNTGDFMKKMSVLNYSREALEACYQDVAAFARSEGLTGHARALEVRFEG